MAAEGSVIACHSVDEWNHHFNHGKESKKLVSIHVARSHFLLRCSWHGFYSDFSENILLVFLRSFLLMHCRVYKRAFCDGFGCLICRSILRSSSFLICTRIRMLITLITCIFQNSLLGICRSLLIFSQKYCPSADYVGRMAQVLFFCIEFRKMHFSQFNSALLIVAVNFEESIIYSNLQQLF